MNDFLGIVLSGGGARGIAHIGVLNALEENLISPQFVSGASMGAVVGVLYAAGKSPQEILELFRHVKLLNLFHWKRPVLGLTDMFFLRKILQKTIGNRGFEDLERKFYVSVSNLQTGEYEIIENGDLIESVVASGSIPMIFKPVELNGSLYVDGGLLNNLPVEPLLDVAKTIIGVSVVAHGNTEDKFDSVSDIAKRCFALSNWQNVQPRLSQCDIVIEPMNSAEHHIFDFKSANKIFEHGYTATMDKMTEILRTLSLQKEDYRVSMMKRMLNDGR